MCKNHKDKSFRDSIVVFLDILGFKNKVQTVRKKNEIKNLFDILFYMNAWNTQNCINTFIEEKDFLNEPYLKGKKINFDKIQKEIQISYFSDSLVITLPYCNKDFIDKVFLVIRATAYLCSKLAITNNFIRGGITIGKMFHETNIFFGPAFLEAYRLESEIANYPRIILSNQLINLIQNNNIPYLKTDNDGLIYIDWVDFIKNGTCTSLKDSIPIIENNLDDNINLYQGNLKILAKYKWLKNQI